MRLKAPILVCYLTASAEVILTAEATTDSLERERNIKRLKDIRSGNRGGSNEAF
jgi:hypothetical protein